MIKTTAWYKYLVNLGDPDKISAEIVREIKSKSSYPFELFIEYGLEAETISQQEYEDLCKKLATIKISK
jgi:hypothetical protein